MQNIVSLTSIVSNSKTMLAKKASLTKKDNKTINKVASIALVTDKNGNPEIPDGNHIVYTGYQLTLIDLKCGYKVTGVVDSTGEKYELTEKDNQIIFTKMDTHH